MKLNPKKTSNWALQFLKVLLGLLFIVFLTSSTYNSSVQLSFSRYNLLHWIPPERHYHASGAHEWRIQTEYFKINLTWENPGCLEAGLSSTSFHPFSPSVDSTWKKIIILWPSAPAPTHSHYSWYLASKSRLYVQFRTDMLGEHATALFSIVEPNISLFQKYA